MRLLWILLLLPGLVCAQSSQVEGSGPLSASASIDIRIVIPPRCHRRPDGSIATNFGPSSGWQYDEGENGVITLSNP